MTARPGLTQTTWNAGELSPAAHGATHLKSYYAGGRRMARLRPIPQGGFTLAAGSRHRATLGAAGAPVRLHPFTWSAETAYMMALRPGALDIFRAADGGYALAASLAAPWDAAAVPEVTVRQRRDTALFLHPDWPTKRLRRLGLTSFAFDDPPFVAIPDVDYGGVYVSRAEVWRLYLSYPTTGFSFGTQVMEMTVSGETTDAISITMTATAATEAAIVAALEALPSIEPGVACVYLGPPTPGVELFEITFGGGNAGGTYDVSGRITSSTQVAAQFTRSVSGDKGGEALFSPTRGYAAAAVYFQDRLVQAGFRSEPGAFLASRPGEYWDLNIEAQAASAAMLVRMDTDAAERIVALARGRHLIILTSESEWFVADRALAANQPPNLVRSSGVGSRPGVPPIEQEGSILFVNKTGTMLYAATYSDVAQGYDARPISLLASHLIEDVTDAALQRGGAATDADRVWLTRGDGLLVCGHLLRDQDVTGFTPWPTDGTVRAVAVDGANTAWIAVERGGTLRLETLEDGLLFDGARSVTPAGATLTGLTEFEGATVWADDSGWIEGPFTVTGGTLTLPETPAGDVTLGRWTAPAMEMLPPPRDVGPRLALRRPLRIHTVRLDLVDTTSVAVAANGRPAEPIALARAGDPVDTPTPAREGLVVATGLTGYTREGRLAITQTRPGRLTVRALTAEGRL